MIFRGNFTRILVDYMVLNIIVARKRLLKRIAIVMLSTLMKRMFGSRNERTLRRMEKTVLAINAFEPQIHALTDEQLAAKTAEFKARFCSYIVYAAF